MSKIVKRCSNYSNMRRVFVADARRDIERTMQHNDFLTLKSLNQRKYDEKP